MIEIEHISKYFKETPALNDITVTIPEGRIALLGPNGAGKSTLLKIVLGLIPPTSGTGRVLGYDIATHGIDIRKKVGYMPEHDCLPDDMNAVEFVSTMGRLSGMSKEKAMERTHEVLHYLNMRDERYRPISTYSGGMRQKVKLAQAIVHDPDIVFMDEPTSALDPMARNEMLHALRAMAEHGHTNFILSTHLLHDVEQICDHVILLNRGRVVIEDSLSNLMRRGPDSLTVRTLGNSEALARLLEDKGFSVMLDGDEVVVERRGPDDMDSIISFMAEAGMPLRQLTVRRRDLDAIYLELIKGGEKNPRK